MRKQIQEVMKEWACLDSETCSDEQIGQALIDLFEETKRLHHRRQLAEDGMEHSLVKTNRDLRGWCEALKYDLTKTVEHYEADLAAVRKRVLTLEKALYEGADQLTYSEGEKCRFKEMYAHTMKEILMRPDGFLQIYGEPLYKLTRDAYGAFAGGDFSGIPMPVPERRK